MDWKEIFPERLRLERERHGWNKKQLADQVGVTNVSILEFEKGRKTPSVDTLIALSCVLGVSLPWLLGLSDHPTSSEGTD